MQAVGLNDTPKIAALLLVGNLLASRRVLPASFSVSSSGGDPHEIVATFSSRGSEMASTGNIRRNDV